MFYHGFPRHWSTLKKLIWLRGSPAGGALGFLKTVTGAIIHILDGIAKPAQSLTVEFSPIQDLHGYDAPWPAGGGKNKIPIPYASGSSVTINDVVFTVDANGVITANGTASANAEFILIPQGYQANLPAGDWTISGLPSGGGSTAFVWNIYAHDPDGNMLFDRRTGAESFTFSPATDIKDLYLGLRIISGYTCNNLKVYPQFESGSTATAWTPYSNICPITGRTGIDTYVRGVNMWDEEWEEGKISTSTGENSSSTTQIRSTNYIEVIGDADYYLKSPAGIALVFYDGNKGYLGAATSNSVYGIATDRTTNNAVYHIPQGVSYVRFYLSSTYGTTYNNDISINYPSTDTEYHAYTGQTYSVTWSDEAGTVYGGTIDLTTGLLTGTMEIATFPTSGWTSQGYGTETNQFSFVPTGISDVGGNNVADIICSYYKTTADLSDTVHVMHRWASVRVFVPLSEFPNATAWENYLSTLTEKPTVVYPLATPVTYQLTPTEVQILLGENNLWSTGDTNTLQYYGSTPPTP